MPTAMAVFHSRDFRTAVVALTLLLCSAAPAYGQLSGCERYRLEFERIGSHVDPNAPSAAERVLEAIGAGEAEKLAGDPEALSELPGIDPKSPVLRQPCYLAYALLALGRVASADGEEFLKRQSETAVNAYIKHYASVAYVMARFRHVPADQQIQALETTASEKGAARTWAVNELCDRSSLKSWPLVADAILAGYLDSDAATGELP